MEKKHSDRLLESQSPLEEELAAAKEEWKSKVAKYVCKYIIFIVNDHNTASYLVLINHKFWYFG